MNNFQVLVVVGTLCTFLFCANVSCQEYKGNDRTPTTPSYDVRPSMLNMMAKLIEQNRTIDEVVNSSTTLQHGMWLNGTQAPPTRCEREETFIDEVTITEKVPYDVQEEVWCFSFEKCYEKKTYHREQKRIENVTKTRMVEVCCEGYQLNEILRLCEPICSYPCENGGVCHKPELCSCGFGYEGSYCGIDALPPGVLAGPNVCDKEEIQTELIKVTNNELVEVSEKKWCWKLMNFRCVETKQEMKPVEKLQQLTKNRVVLTCCDGFEKNYNGNRCIPVQQLEEYQKEEYQQIIQ